MFALLLSALNSYCLPSTPTVCPGLTEETGVRHEDSARVAQRTWGQACDLFQVSESESLHSSNSTILQSVSLSLSLSLLLYNIIVLYLCTV